MLQRAGELRAPAAGQHLRAFRADVQVGQYLFHCSVEACAPSMVSASSGLPCLIAAT